MQQQKQNQVSEIIAHTMAEFIVRESNRQSLITVTRANVAPDSSYSTVFVSVLPETAESAALSFLKRMRAEAREYLKENSKLRVLPRIDFEIDYGEKNRQRMDELSREDRTK